MKNINVKNEVLNIKEVKNIEETIFFRKVTPKFFSHDEDEYHIESKVEVVLNYINNEDNFEEKIITFHDEHQIEYIGQEVEVEIDEFIELRIETPEFSNAKNEAYQFIETLKKEFSLQN